MCFGGGGDSYNPAQDTHPATWQNGTAQTVDEGIRKTKVAPPTYVNPVDAAASATPKMDLRGTGSQAAGLNTLAM